MQKCQINCPEDSAADRRDPEPLPPSSGPSPVRLFSGLSAPFSPFPFKCFTAGLYAFPTTYVVDQNGNIVGQPIVGAVTSPEQTKALNALIEQALATCKRNPRPV